MTFSEIPMTSLPPLYFWSWKAQLSQLLWYFHLIMQVFHTHLITEKLMLLENKYFQILFKNMFPFIKIKSLIWLKWIQIFLSSLICIAIIFLFAMCQITFDKMKLSYSLQYSSIQQIFTKYLLIARECFGFWGHSHKQSTQLCLSLVLLWKQ